LFNIETAVDVSSIAFKVFDELNDVNTQQLYLPSNFLDAIPI